MRLIFVYHVRGTITCNNLLEVTSNAISRRREAYTSRVIFTKVELVLCRQHSLKKIGDFRVVEMVHVARQQWMGSK